MNILLKVSRMSHLLIEAERAAIKSADDTIALLGEDEG